MLNLRLNRKPIPMTDPTAQTDRSLATLCRGDTACVACIECANAARCERLMAYGLVQGQLVRVIQTSPAFVIRVDETELALDRDVARCIRVQPV